MSKSAHPLVRIARGGSPAPHKLVLTTLCLNSNISFTLRKKDQHRLLVNLFKLSSGSSTPKAFGKHKVFLGTWPSVSFCRRLPPFPRRMWRGLFSVPSRLSIFLESYRASPFNYSSDLENTPISINVYRAMFLTGVTNDSGLPNDMDFDFSRIA